jgi:hypothetical protein
LVWGIKLAVQSFCFVCGGWKIVWYLLMNVD